ncbi:Eco57I restriction-modification methylase domain-containing protein [Sphingopyxis sp. BSN-002]|uniref:Eco57I restriction-modification methylase domain-containing protein n=1 Tax=Sphingopyxis sp. BSN-002 TaxID=2911495 RepID=UPI001EDB1D3E|nr:Eco57I restriction-modification methylase domain-containing protein [Sphingopyxis sp. BSN-002]UKK85759.1 Eco57I restriction-modification methylase domain-containing protein [Sphingopyxis sp. BSN-002]
MTEPPETLAPGRATFTLKNRNPDVLTCIANLSNDEVFTPPEFANRMLDTLAEGWASVNDGADIWADSKVTFLDPCTKSGVFLREITKRLIKGLEGEIPHLQARVDHILTKQVFGIGITRLTSLLARRSLYCSKHATGAHSVAKSFGDNDDGNIWFARTEHLRDGDRCKVCGAGMEFLGRGPDAENHAYAFIHSDNINKRLVALFGDKMHFDVIIGNPPYQISADEAGQNVMPIYNLFVEQAKRLEPRFLTMVTPSRWMAGGKHLDDFRSTMLNDERLAALVDFPNAAEMFPSVGINGGISYFLWDSSHQGECAVTTIRGGSEYGPHERKLNEFDVFIRDVRSVGILRKVRAFDEPTLSEIVSPRDPFGPALSSNFKDYHASKQDGDLRLHFNVGTKRETAWVSPKYVTKSDHLVHTWKLLIPKAGSGREREKSGVDLVLGPPMVAAPGSVCTLTYVVAGPFDSKDEADSAHSFLRTRFARFLVSLRKISQDAPRGVYAFVPQQSWDRSWTDADLYQKYGIADDEIAFIESMIRPMDAVIA